MKTYLKPLARLCAVGLSLMLVACNDNQSTAPLTGAAVTEPLQTEKITLDVYKSPSCGCCDDWIEHVKTAGFETRAHHPNDLSLVKAANGIDSSMQSCHTAVSDQGYVFEGHVPASVIQDFLAKPPADALGLAVPGMPIGSPGMEMGDRYDDYQVILIKKDGSATVYREITADGHYK